LLFAAALLFSSIIAQAQAQQPQPQKPVKTGDEWKMPGDVLQRSRHFADSLKKNLNLDAATTQQIFQAYMNNTKPVDEINITTTDPTARKEKVKANHAAFNEKLKSILSPAQYQKYLQADAARLF
ncbi:MAG TPA: hypothetical protein VNW04_20190, partial [Puia sp.]|nr:hypothetical protein [Puia sp.]